MNVHRPSSKRTCPLFITKNIFHNRSMSTKTLDKSKVGRPAVVTDDVVRKLEAALAAGFSVTVACHISGISRDTFYNYKVMDKDFSDKMKLAEEWSTYRARLTILKP